MERIAKNIREIMKNQEIILQREDTLEEMKEMVMNLHKLAESNSLTKEREIIIQLLDFYHQFTHISRNLIKQIIIYLVTYERAYSLH